MAPNSMTLNTKIGGYMDLFADFGLRHKSIIHKVAPRNYRYAIQIKNLIFVYYLSVNTPIFS